MTNQNNAGMTIPGSTKNMSTEPKIVTQVQKMNKIFRNPPQSAHAPMIGDKRATDIPEMVIALDHSAVPTIWFSAITVAK